MVEPRVDPARRAHAVAPRHRSRRAQGSLPPPPVRPHRLPRRRQRPRSAARPPPEGLRHRHVGASVSGQEAVPELLDHRPPLPPRAREVRTEGDRGGDVPPPGAARRGNRRRTACRRRDHRVDARAGDASCSTATTPSARPKRMRSAATSRSTRSSTTSRRSRSSTTSDGIEDLRAGIVRSIGDPEVRFLEDPVRMLRAVALAARLDFTIDPPIARRDSAPPPRDRAQLAAAAARGVLQDPARRVTPEKTFRGLADAGLLEPISAELHHGADEPLWRSLAGARRVPRAVRVDARDVHQPDAARQPARAARLSRRQPVRHADRGSPSGRAGAARRTAAGRAAARAARRRAAAPDARPAAAAARRRAPTRARSAR